MYGGNIGKYRGGSPVPHTRHNETSLDVSGLDPLPFL